MATRRSRLRRNYEMDFPIWVEDKKISRIASIDHNVKFISDIYLWKFTSEPTCLISVIKFTALIIRRRF